MHIKQHYVKHRSLILSFCRAFWTLKAFCMLNLEIRKPQQRSKSGNTSQTHTHSSSQPKTAFDHQTHLPEPNHHTPAEHTLTHTHLQNNEEKHKYHSCVRRQKRLWEQINKHNGGRSHSERDVRDRVGNGVRDAFDRTHLCLPLSGEQWKGLASSGTVAAHRDNEAGRERERERTREGGRGMREWEVDEGEWKSRRRESERGSEVDGQSM